MDRIDEALYHDFETEQEKAKRVSKLEKDVARMVQQAKKKGDSQDVIEQKKKDFIQKQHSKAASK